MMTQVQQAPVQGYSHQAFEPVRQAFQQNFIDGLETGASLAIEIDGQRVLDLWGGHTDATNTQAWGKDTLSIVFSNTKPATALCAHRLVQDGMLDLDKPLGHYWPAFAEGPRRQITPRMLLDHSAGLPALREKLPHDAAFDWDYMVSRLEREMPFWEPGTRVGYHGLTFGWLVGELVRRVSGVDLGIYFRRQFAEPLGLDFWIGLPEEHEHRVAVISAPPAAQAPRNAFEAEIATRPDSIAAQYYANTGGWRPAGFNSRAGHAAQLGAANGITNARSLARLYGTLAIGGSREGASVLDPDVLDSATRISSATHKDACLCVPTRFAAGFMREMDNRAVGADSACIGRDAYGHVGAGGSVAFASPSRRMGFAYTMNRMGAGVLLNERADRLITATYQVLARLDQDLKPHSPS
ncbi:beta-lactamase family protein [Pusillimonas sp. MFBS29]|uniref:serine hydrolase domain-containing protein n=1 Tax=Pusillimonas sp. MFBS29 TaxID=2886690 RepID=UPI001D1015F3|nr:serine hydrolase domain-containing protein [Pusillimonas sp. MFBS29]MCC2597158.1 beta-lactamase family protein [Pusillimonas sp. MFBS29]